MDPSVWYSIHASQLPHVITRFIQIKIARRGGHREYTRINTTACDYEHAAEEAREKTGVSLPQLSAPQVSARLNGDMMMMIDD